MDNGFNALPIYIYCSDSGIGFPMQPMAPLAPPTSFRAPLRPLLSNNNKNMLIPCC